MAPSDKPVRLRRATFGAGPAPGSTIGSTQITPQLVVEDGLVHGTSNPGNERSQGVYDDPAHAASPTPGQATATIPVPFTLER